MIFTSKTQENIMIDSRDPFFQRLFGWLSSRPASGTGLLGNTDVTPGVTTRRGLLGPSEPGIVVQAADVPNQPWYKRGLGYIPDGQATPQELDEMTDAELTQWWQQLNKKKGDSK